MEWDSGRSGPMGPDCLWNRVNWGEGVGLRQQKDPGSGPGDRGPGFTPNTRLPLRLR